MTRHRSITLPSTVSARPRAVGGTTRAESPDLVRVVTEINTEFKAFRARNDARVDALEAGLDRQIADQVIARLGGGGVGAGLRPRFSEGAAAQLRGMMQGNPQARSMTTQSDPDGGYTVVPELDGTIDGVLREISPLRGLARQVNQLAGTGDWEKIIQTHGSQSGWAGEEDDRDDGDEPQFGKVTITPHEIFAIPSLTNHMLDDSSFNLETFLEEDVAGEFAVEEGSAFVSGSGTKKPRGFLSNPVSTDGDATRAFGTLQYIKTGVNGGFAASDPGDKLKDLLATLKPAYRKGPGVAWLMNSTTANVISKMKDGQDNYLWTESVIEGQPDRLLGYPVALDEGMPDIANDAFAVAFGNWRRGYAIVDKPGIKLIVDKVTRKGWTKLYFSKRVGGGTLDTRALKLLQFKA